MATAASILEYARRLEELELGKLVALIFRETGEDHRESDLLDRVIRLIEIFGVEGAGPIVGCPRI